MGIRGVERRLERLVEGTFGMLFRSDLRPVELGRRLVRAMDAGQDIGVHGEVLAPNHFVISISPDDEERLVEVQESLRRELADAARDHAREEGYQFAGPVAVELAASPGLRAGAYRIDARIREAPGGRPPGSLVLPTGERVVLGESIVQVGRLPECAIVVSDPNVSRVHVEIRPSGTGFAVVDLGSTNGTRLNGDRITERMLRDGDEITVGTTTIRFEAS